MEWFFRYLSHFTRFTIFDAIDIIFLTVILFWVYHFIKERRASKLALGVGILFVFLIICEVLNLRAMRFLLSNFFQVGIVLIALIFQPEIRSALEKMGDNSIMIKP